MAVRQDADRVIRLGFLDSESRKDLIELTRDGSAAHRLARRANALVLLDDGMSCESVAKELRLDSDTIRTWHRLYQEDGIEGLASFGHEGGACRLTAEQQERLTAWVTATLPRTSREIGAWLALKSGIEYEGRSGLIALLHRLGMEHRKPMATSRKLDPAKQAYLQVNYGVPTGLGRPVTPPRAGTIRHSICDRSCSPICCDRRARGCATRDGKPPTSQRRSAGGRFSGWLRIGCVTVRQPTARWTS